MTEYNEEITKLKGVGEKTAVLFNKIGVFSFEDLLYYFPKDYIKYEAAVTAASDRTGRLMAFEAVVLGRPLIKRTGRLQIVSARLKSGDNEVNAVWFNMPYLAKSLKAGTACILYGRIYKSGERLCTDQPVIFTREKYEEIENTLQPVYHLTKGLSNNTVKKAVKQLLEMPLHTDPDHDFHSMHFPGSLSDLKRAREGFVYEEFFMYALRLRFLREKNDRAVNSFNIRECPETERIIEGLPYSLTAAQKRVWDEIKGDLSSSSSMNRLVQGDVGSGKTIIAFLAALMTAANGYQCAIMAPTEILASQHFEALSALIKRQGLDIECALLTGSTKAAQKKQLYRGIEDGSIRIVVGTQALFQKKVNYGNLALVITDEQHRFGVAQRESLLKKGENDTPHVLVMSATPIPRTLAIILYGDLDVSVIDEVPAKRLPIKNCVVDESSHDKAFRFMAKEITAGHQCYVICPLVEESEGAEDLKDVINYTEVLKSRFPASVSIAALHGKMKPAEKARVMEGFYGNEIQILVSTTVVEVGVNVPAATVMLIENAERFGLAQLHQLRGRIGRGDSQSYCIFINGNDNEQTRERLSVLVSTNDGFEIASKDLKLRGPGDIFGIRQSGELSFKIADIFTDADILKRAAEDVTKLLEEDPGLCKPEHEMLREKLFSLLGEQESTVL